MSPVAAHPSPSTLDRLAHEHGLKEELDRDWAMRPLEIVRDAGRTMLVLEDVGGFEPLDRLLATFSSFPKSVMSPASPQRRGSPLARFLLASTRVARAGSHQRGIFWEKTLEKERAAQAALQEKRIHIPGICMISMTSTQAPGICRCGWSLPKIFDAESAESAWTIE